MTWQLKFSKAAAKDVSKLASAGLRPEVQELMDALRHNPWQNPLPCE